MDLAQKPVYKLDLAAGTSVVNLTTPLVEGDDRAQTFTLELTDKGTPANLDGYSVTAYFGRGKTAEAEADTIPLSGTVSGNVATITLTESCYSRSCYFSMPIRLSNGATGQKRTYLIVRGTVVKSVDGTIIDPDGSVPSLDDLFAQIAVMERSRQAAEEATEEALAAAARADEAREGIQGDLATLSEEIVDAEQLCGWWMPRDKFVMTTNDAYRHLLLNVSKFDVVVHEKQTQVQLYEYIINGDGSIDMKIRYNHDADNRTDSFSVNLPVATEYTEFEYSNNSIDITIGYVTEIVSNLQTKILTDWNADEVIWLRTIYKENPLIDATNFGFVDNRLFSKCTIFNSGVECVTVNRIQYGDYGSSYLYYAEYDVLYSDGSTKGYTMADDVVRNGAFVDVFEDFSLTINADILLKYGTRLEGKNITLNKSAYITVVSAKTPLYNNVNNNLTDYDFTSLINKNHSAVAPWGTVVKDYTHIYNNNNFSYKLSGVATDEKTPEVMFEFAEAVSLQGLQEVDVPVYIEDPSKISSINLHILNGTTSLWIQWVVGFKKGWNVKRFLIASKYTNTLKNWTVATRFGLICNLTEQSSICIGDIILVKPNKAKVIFVNDHGYSNFKNVAYPRLKEIGIPVTWGIKIGMLGNEIEYASNILTLAEVEELAVDGNSEINVHSWRDHTLTTLAELKAEELKSENWLKKNGYYTEPFWRSAFPQNDEPLAVQMKDMLKLNACYDNITDRYEAFPFIDKNNIHRIGIHGLTQETVDNIFDTLEKTHCTVVLYTHDISDQTPPTGIERIHMTSAEFDYFYSKLESAVNAGWLEGTTVSRLYNRYFNDIPLFR